VITPRLLAPDELAAIKARDALPSPQGVDVFTDRHDLLAHVVALEEVLVGVWADALYAEGKNQAAARGQVDEHLARLRGEIV
jgi:hypothetical protein